MESREGMGGGPSWGPNNRFAFTLWIPFPLSEPNPLESKLSQTKEGIKQKRSVGLKTEGLRVSFFPLLCAIGS